MTYTGIINAKLIRSIRAGQCMIFVGAGLSAQVIHPQTQKPLPLWKDMLHGMIGWARDRQICFVGKPEEIEQMIEAGNLLMAAQELEECLSQEQIGQFLTEVFSGVQPSPAHRALPYIPFRAVLTSNYDTLIEDAYEQESGARPEHFTQEKLFEIGLALRHERFFILKLHGHLGEQESIVLGSHSYQELLFRTTGYRQFLETLFSVYTVLFVGFGASDPDVETTLERLAAIYARTLENHFILLPQNRLNPTEKRRWAKDRDLEVIEYVQGGEEDHTQVEAFLHELKRQVAEQPLARESAQYGEGRLKVFISGAHEDNDLLKALAGEIKAAGYAAWLTAEHDLAGVNPRQVAAEALDQADVALVVYTPAALTSKFVEDEAKIALHNETYGETVLIPLVAGEGVEIPAYVSGKEIYKLPSPLAPLPKERGENGVKALLEALVEAEVRRREYREGRFDALPERALVRRAEGVLRKFAGRRVDGGFFGATGEISLPGDGEKAWCVRVAGADEVVDREASDGRRLWAVSVGEFSAEAQSRMRERGVLFSSLADIEVLEGALG